MAGTKCIVSNEVVYFSAAILLGAADSRNQHRGKKEGPLPNVDAPFYHHRSPRLRLRLRFLQCVERGVVSDGYRGLFATGT